MKDAKRNLFMRIYFAVKKLEMYVVSTNVRHIYYFTNIYSHQCSENKKGYVASFAILQNLPGFTND